MCERTHVEWVDSISSILHAVEVDLTLAMARMLHCACTLSNSE